MKKKHLWNVGKKGSFEKGRIPHNKGKTTKNYEPLRRVGMKIAAARKRKKWFLHPIDWSEKNRKIGLAHKGEIKSPEHIQKIISNPNYIKSRLKLAKLNRSPEKRKSQSIKAIAKYKNKEYYEKWMLAWRKGIAEKWDKRPTRLERKVIELLGNANLPYKYCGDFTFWIGRQNPDFINTNGQKICLEIASKTDKSFRFGSWKKYESKRTANFKKYGFDCLVLWEDDLEALNFGNKIVEFERFCLL